MYVKYHCLVCRHICDTWWFQIMNGSRGYQASSQIRFYKRLDRITALLTMHNALAVRAPFEGNNSEAAYLGVVESLHHTCTQPNGDGYILRRDRTPVYFFHSTAQCTILLATVHRIVTLPRLHIRRTRVHLLLVRMAAHNRVRADMVISNLLPRSPLVVEQTRNFINGFQLWISIGVGRSL